MNKKKGHEQSTDDGPDAFEHINLPNGGDIFSDILGIKFTPVSEEGTLGERYREEDQERGVKDWRKAKPLSGSGNKDVFEYSREIDGKWKGQGEKELEGHEDL